MSLKTESIEQRTKQETSCDDRYVKVLKSNFVHWIFESKSITSGTSYLGRLDGVLMAQFSGLEIEYPEIWLLSRGLKC